MFGSFPYDCIICNRLLNPNEEFFMLYNKASTMAVEHCLFDPLTLASYRCCPSQPWEPPKLKFSHREAEEKTAIGTGNLQLFCSKLVTWKT